MLCNNQVEHGINQPNRQAQEEMRAPNGMNVADKAREMGIALQRGPVQNIDDDRAAEHADSKNALDNNDNENDKPQMIGQGLRGNAIGRNRGDDGFNEREDKDRVSHCFSFTLDFACMDRLRLAISVKSAPTVGTIFVAVLKLIYFTLLIFISYLMFSFGLIFFLNMNFTLFIFFFDLALSAQRICILAQIFVL